MLFIGGGGGVLQALSIFYDLWERKSSKKNFLKKTTLKKQTKN